MESSSRVGTRSMYSSMASGLILDRRESCRSMARDLGRSASTVHDEVVRNRVVTRGPGKGDNVEGTDGPPYRKLALSMIRENQAKRILPIA